LFVSSEAAIEEITDYKNVPVFDDPTVFVAVLLAHGSVLNSHIKCGFV